ncbi:hypothetical protein C8J56DRAFT_1028118 [Mycena floridula]|nr:hypothetical protein C8J56DRAFT_1028118 [Mycena floridula]
MKKQLVWRGELLLADRKSKVLGETALARTTTSVENASPLSCPTPDIAGKLKAEEEKWRSRRYIRRGPGCWRVDRGGGGLGGSSTVDGERRGNGPTNGMKKNDLMIHGQKTKEEKCDQKMEERKKTKLSQSPHPNLHTRRKHVSQCRVDPALGAKADERQRAKGIPSSIWLYEGE